MKVAFIVDYFSELNSSSEWSGAEVSVRLLADLLQKENIEVKTISPGKGIYVLGRRIFPTWLTVSPLWFFFTAIYIFIELNRYKVDIIHVHGKNSIVGSYIANLLLRRHIVVTVRDYRAVCDLGMCLIKDGIPCSIREYFFRDIPFFVNKYKVPSVWNYLYSYFVGFYQFPMRYLYRFILRKVDRVICISHGQEKIYRIFGLENTQVIYNVAAIYKKSYKKKKRIFFGGRLTYGKGKEILEKVIPRFLVSYPGWTVVTVGKRIININDSRVIKLGQISYGDYLEKVGESCLSLVPSIWPEPFGRAALDSIAVDTPVVATNCGGLPEIIDNGFNGIITKPDLDSFWAGINKAVENCKIFTKNIENDRRNFENKFVKVPVLSHQNLYISLLKK